MKNLKKINNPEDIVLRNLYFIMPKKKNIGTLMGCYVIDSVQKLSALDKNHPEKSIYKFEVSSFHSLIFNFQGYDIYSLYDGKNCATEEKMEKLKQALPDLKEGAKNRFNLLDIRGQICKD
jgi:hypothetical protein